MTAVLYYGIFVGLSSLISFQDWRERKIRNRLIAIGLLACGTGFLVLLLNSLLGVRHARFWLLGEYYLPLHYYPRALAHVFISALGGVVLWRYSIWPAGDAKYFMLAAVFAALIDPNLPGFPYLLSLVLLINIFVPAGLVFVLETIANLALGIPRLRTVDWRTRLKAGAETAAIRIRDVWPHRVKYLILTVNLFALFFSLQMSASRGLKIIREPWRSLAIFIVMFVFWSKLAVVLRNKTVGIAAFAGVCITVLVGVFHLHWDVRTGVSAAVRMTVNFGMFLSLSRMLFHWIIERDSLHELRVSDLKSGDILSDKTWEMIKTEKELAGKIDTRYVDGISDSDAVTLKDWLTSRMAPSCVVYKTIPFAFWIFLGTLLTISYRGSVVTALASGFTQARHVLEGGNWRKGL